MADYDQPDYRDTELYIALRETLEYAEDLMGSFDKLFELKNVRNLDEQIILFDSQSGQLKILLTTHREADDLIPEECWYELGGRFTAMTKRWKETGYPAELRAEYRNKIHELLQILQSHHRSARCNRSAAGEQHA